MFLNFLVLVFHEHATIGCSLIGSYKIRNDNYVVSYNQYAPKYENAVNKAVNNRKFL